MYKIRAFDLKVGDVFFLDYVKIRRTVLNTKFYTHRYQELVAITFLSEHEKDGLKNKEFYTYNKNFEFHGVKYIIKKEKEIDVLDFV